MSSSEREGRARLIAAPAQRLAHATNKKIATLAVSAFDAKQARKARRKNAAAESAPTRERLAKGGLGLVPIYAPNGFLEGYRYETQSSPAPLDRYKPLLPKRVQNALAFFAHGELLRETAPFRNLTSKVDREIFPAEPGRKLGGMARLDKDERREYERHEFGLQQLRALDDAEDRVSIEDTLRAVVSYARDGLMGKPVKLADIGRKLWNFEGEEAAKGVAVGAILVAGKFLTRRYEWFDAQYRPGLPSPTRQLGPPAKL